MPDPLPFAEALRRHRLRLGLSQQELAERAGLSARGISDLERGARRLPQHATVHLLAAALALPADEAARFVAAARGRPSAAPAVPSNGPDLDAAADAPLAGLPRPLTSFVGRGRELALLAELLAASRLLTLTGAAGIGKTRLALELTARAQGRYAGAYFVALAPLRDLGLVLPTVARALGLRDVGTRPLFERLVAVVGRRPLLLLLDNLEHLAATGPEVAALLAACPTLTVLATSRAPLGIGGEQEFRVPPLGLPAATGQRAAPDGEPPEAVRLFVERARAALPTFEPDAADAAAVGEICRRLDGLPLAIELAAARVKLLPPRAMLPRLGRRLDLLRGGGGDRPERQRTMRAALEWSFDLLGEAEQALFRRLGAFLGGWSLDAAEALCAAYGGSAGALDGLAALLDQGLVQQVPGPPGEARYAMLETVREYAQERLDAAGETTSLRAWHGAYYLGLVQAAARPILGPDQAAWLDRLTAEQDNLRAALRWCLETGRAERGLPVAGSIFWLSYLRGHVADGRSWLKRLLAAPEAAAPTAGRATALTWAGVLAFLSDAPATALTWLHQGLAVADISGDAAATALARLWLGTIHIEAAGDLDAAAPLLRGSLAGFRRLRDHWGMAESLCRLADIANRRGRHEEAAALAAEALAAARSQGDLRAIGYATEQAGIAAGMAGRFGEARALLADSIGAYERLGDRSGVSSALRRLGRFALREGDSAAAEAWFRASLRRTCDGTLGTARIVRGLEEVAVAVAGRHPRRCLRLAAAGCALRAALALPPAEEREGLEDAVARARRELTANDADSAWAAGRALSLEQAIAAALDEDAAPDG